MLKLREGMHLQMVRLNHIVVIPIGKAALHNSGVFFSLPLPDGCVSEL